MKDIFFSHAYGKLYENIESDTCEIFDFSCEYGKMRNIFMKREIPQLFDGVKYFDISTPYGYGGPLILETADTKMLLDRYYEKFSEYCFKQNIVSEFVRFHLFENIEVKNYYYGKVVETSSNIVRNMDLTIDEIWMDFEQKVRKNIKNAIKKELKIEIDTKGLTLKGFLEIYYETMQRNNANHYYYFPEIYFEKIKTQLQGHFAYFNVLLDGKIISTELVIFSEKYVYSFLGGTKIEFYSFRPNDFLKFEIIKWCKETSKRYFILGGGLNPNDGIFKYKKGFAPNGIYPFFTGTKIHNKIIYDYLVESKMKQPGFNKDTKYFPKYRG